ncbi:Uncharacterised protein [Mycobacterium tuberculosis]|uniref:Uncharacterized protein n=1 Tax=Mycobacterium tuberculosis TaxID=1773 RepID=A0A916LB28_MYCTX|nr:Uncharacterised protein [Mycobacterium tuberculosis]
MVEKTSRMMTRTSRESRSASERMMSANFGVISTTSTGCPRRANARALRPVPAPISSTRCVVGSAASLASAHTRASGSVPKSGGSRVAIQFSYSCATVRHWARTW